MKKALMFRLFAIAAFCLAYLAIKSETSSCTEFCSGIVKKGLKDKIKTLVESTNNSKDADYKYDTFFIKI